MSVAALRAEGFGVRFGRTAVFHGAHFSIPAGAFLLVTGANGTGKSTFLRCAAGMAFPTSGKLLRFGVEPRQANPAERRRIGFLSHDLFLHDTLTPAENLAYWGALYGIQTDAADILRRLDGLGLSPWRGQPVAALSRGLRQRLGFLRATLHAPDLLLLDEPFTGLDAETTAHLAQALFQLNRAGVTVASAVHDPAPLAARATHGLVLSEGRMRLVAAPDNRTAPVPHPEPPVRKADPERGGHD